MENFISDTNIFYQQENNLHDIALNPGPKLNNKGEIIKYTIVGKKEWFIK